MLEEIGYVLLGLFMLVVPGFLFSLVLYPYKESLDFWKRMGVSFGLGVLLLIYVGFVLAQPGLMMLKLAPFIGAVLVVCVILAVLAHLRGGLEVIVASKRVVTKVFRKLKPSKPPQPPQPEQVPETIQGEVPKEAPEQAPEKAPGSLSHPDEES